MIFAFQDRENLYLVMDLMSCGDLRYHINKKQLFNELQASKIPLYKTYLKKIKSFLFHV